MVLVTLTGMAGSAQVSVSNTAALTFGSLVPGPAGGTATVPHDGSGRSCSGDIVCIPQDPGSAARFEVTGDALASYTITLPDTATLSDGAGNSLSLGDFIDSEGGSGSLDLNGSDVFTVGATLSVGGGQPSGIYGGTFDVLVEYE